MTERTLTLHRLAPGGRRFVVHFIEMLLAMLLGMAVVAAAAAAALALAGTSYGAAERDAPGLFVLGMAIGMTAPMLAWMRHRGHPRARIAEMATAMLAVAAVIVALLAAGMVGGQAAVDAQHTAMIPVMLGVMLLRRRAYARSVPPPAG